MNYRYGTSGKFIQFPKYITLMRAGRLTGFLFLYAGLVSLSWGLLARSDVSPVYVIGMIAIAPAFFFTGVELIRRNSDQSLRTVHPADVILGVVFAGFTAFAVLSAI